VSEAGKLCEIFTFFMRLRWLPVEIDDDGKVVGKACFNILIPTTNFKITGVFDHVESEIDNICFDKDLGVGIFCKENYTISRDFNTQVENRYVLPFCIKNMTEKSFKLFAVWTKSVDRQKKFYANYHTPVFNALNKKNSKFENSIILGDFNTGADKSDSKQWYTNLASEMKNAGLKNCAGEDGQELCPTFFRGNGSWLDDHCFASSDIKVISFGIGIRDYWEQYSDHCPIVVDFDW
jgi:exonuclease III